MFMEGSRDITQSMPVGTMHRECEDTEQFHKTLLTGGTQKRKIKWEVIFSSTMMDGIGKWDPPLFHRLEVQVENC